MAAAPLPSPAFGTAAEWTAFQLDVLDGVLGFAVRGAHYSTPEELCAAISRCVWRVLLLGTWG